MMDDVERIAKGLTEAQREALRRLGEDRYRAARHLKVAGATLHALWNRPPGPNLEPPDMLVTRDVFEHPPRYAYKLTPLGAKVRTYLQENPDNA